MTIENNYHFSKLDWDVVFKLISLGYLQDSKGSKRPDLVYVNKHGLAMAFKAGPIPWEPLDNYIKVLNSGGGWGQIIRLEDLEEPLRLLAKSIKDKVSTSRGALEGVSWDGKGVYPEYLRYSGVDGSIYVGAVEFCGFALNGFILIEDIENMNSDDRMNVAANYLDSKYREKGLGVVPDILNIWRTYGEIYDGSSILDDSDRLWKMISGSLN